MSAVDEIKFEKEVDKIEAELGEEHLIQILQHLTSSSPEASQGLIKLHAECRDVIAKYPPLGTQTEKPKKRTQSQEIMNRQNSTSTQPRPHRVQTEKPRFMLTKRTQSLVSR